jgi:hypothetical protein
MTSGRTAADGSLGRQRPFMAHRSAEWTLWNHGIQGHKLDSMLVTATPELRSHVMDHGGSLFVHYQRRGVPFLQAGTKEPRSLAEYELFVVEEMLILARLPARVRPKELHLSLEGRRRKRPVAAWDGCAYIV